MGCRFYSLIVAALLGLLAIGASLTPPGADNATIREIDDGLGHVAKINGIWYFVQTTGSDANAGDDPHVPFATIGHALSVATSGDHIRISGGTYAEDGLEMAVEDRKSVV